MPHSAEIIGLKAKTEAAQQLAKMRDFSEPLSEKQRELVLLLLASAYTAGMIDAIKGLEL